MKKKRILEIDLIKGIAIILMVFGHLIYFIKPNILSKILFDSIYVFHMPIFFWISGYLFKPEFIILDKINRILIPLIFFSIPHIVKHILTFYWSKNMFDNFLYECVNVLGGGYYWYLSYLLIYYLISRFFCKNLRGCIFIILLILLTVIISDMSNYESKILWCLYNYLFFLGGYICNALYKENIFYRRISIYKVIGCFLGCVFLIMCYLKMGNLSIRLIAAYVCIYLVIKISHIMCILSNYFKKLNKIVNYISYLGTISLTIYLLDGYLISVEEKIWRTFIVNSCISRWCLVFSILYFNILVSVILDKCIKKVKGLERIVGN